MTGNKRSRTDVTNRRPRLETPEHPSAHQDTKEKSKQKLYPKEDKNKTAQQEHTNGSTPKSRL